MKQLKLGDWVVPGTLVTPETGTEYIRDFFGIPHTTKIMPDGCEWTTVDYLGPGNMDHPTEYPNGIFYPILAHYRFADIMAQSLPEGWRVPTVSDWNTLISTAGGPSSAGAMKVVGIVPGFGDGVDPLGFAAPNVGASGLFGFNAWPSGYYPEPIHQGSAPSGLYAYGMYWADSDGAPYRMLFRGDTQSVVVDTDSYVGNPQYEFSVRLVREAVPVYTSARYGHHDIILDDAGSAALVEDLAQRVDCRLRTFQGEHWLNPEIGVPWFEEFLGQKNPNLSVCRSLLLTVIQGVPGVTAVTSLDLSFAKNSNSRVLEVRFTVTGTDSLPVSGTTAVTA